MSITYCTFASENTKLQSSVSLKGTAILNKKKRDFVEKVDEIQKQFRIQGLNYKLRDICRLAASLPAPQFYVDVETAVKEYNLYEKGLSCVRNVTKRRMYAEIFARYEKIAGTVADTGQMVNKRSIMAKVLQQPAPSFYYSDNSAWKSYYYIMSRRRRFKL